MPSRTRGPIGPAADHALALAARSSLIMVATAVFLAGDVSISDSAREQAAKERLRPQANQAVIQSCFFRKPLVGSQQILRPPVARVKNLSRVE